VDKVADTINQVAQGKFSRTCFNCGKPGHFANVCPEPKKPRFRDMLLLAQEHFSDLSLESSPSLEAETIETQSEPEPEPPMPQILEFDTPAEEFMYLLTGGDYFSEN